MPRGNGSEDAPACECRMMTMPSTFRRGLFVLLAVSMSWGTACGSDDPPNSSPNVAGSGAAIMDMSCPADTPPFNFGPTGLLAANETLGVKVFLEEASSKPPFFGMNDWTIDITDMTGNPMPQATLTWACAFMPLHGHGSNPKMVENLGGGRYKLLKQNMAMGGQWEIRVWVDPKGGGEAYTGGIGGAPSVCAMPGDPLVLRACVPRQI
jgi:hypothetical protein